jgi:small subunit ribosomal protein S7
MHLYNKLLGFLVKKGKKNKAKNVLDNAFSIVSEKTGYSMAYILFKVFLKLNVFVEAKTVRVKRRSHIVPFSLNLKRRSYLIIKWLIKSVSDNKKKINSSNKIAEEIFCLINNTNSKALKLRNLNNNLSLSNRSNIHYRW